MCKNIKYLSIYDPIFSIFLDSVIREGFKELNSSPVGSVFFTNMGDYNEVLFCSKNWASFSNASVGFYELF